MLTLPSRVLEFLAIEWVKLFKKQPIVTLISTLLFFGSAGVAAYFLNQADINRSETIRLKRLDYQTQIQQLNQTENNIRQLLIFVERQKNSLRETEDTIAYLKKEQEKLKPVVESDRAFVDALFRTQEERNRATIWRERLIGFGIGIVASLIATFIWFVATLLLNGGHNKINTSDRQTTPGSG